MKKIIYSVNAECNIMRILRLFGFQHEYAREKTLAAEIGGRGYVYRRSLKTPGNAAGMRGVWSTEDRRVSSDAPKLGEFTTGRDGYYSLNFKQLDSSIKTLYTWIEEKDICSSVSIVTIESDGEEQFGYAEPLCVWETNSEFPSVNRRIAIHSDDFIIAVAGKHNELVKASKSNITANRSEWVRTTAFWSLMEVYCTCLALSGHAW